MSAGLHPRADNLRRLGWLSSKSGFLYVCLWRFEQGVARDHCVGVCLCVHVCMGLRYVATLSVCVPLLAV